jgi:hypothetical protein
MTPQQRENHQGSQKIGQPIVEVPCPLALISKPYRANRHVRKQNIEIVTVRQSVSTRILPGRESLWKKNSMATWPLQAVV